MANGYESDVRKLVAYDNLDIPLCALHNRVDRKHGKLARALEAPIDAGENFGCANVAVVYEDKKKARAMRDGVNQFCDKYPSEGRELQKMISSKRTIRETHLHYGIPEGRRISSQDYVQAMVDVGLTQTQAEAFYPKVLDVLRTLQRLRGKKTTSAGLRDVLIGTSEI